MYKELVDRKRKNFSKITLISNKETMQFVTQEGKEQYGNHVAVHEVVGDYPAHVQKTGISYRSFTATVVVGKGDNYWEQDADRFRAMCTASSNQTPLLLEGMPQVPNINCIIGVISNSFSSLQGVTVFNIVIYPIYSDTVPKLNYNKLLFDELADTIDSWTDKVNNAFAYVETTQSYISSVSNFFTSIADLLSSGVQYIDFTSDLLGTLKNPFALGSPLINTLKAYTEAINKLVQTATTERIANNPSIFFRQSYPYPNNQYSKGQEDFLIKLSNLSTMAFLLSSAQVINSSFIKFDNLINYRKQVLSMINNMIMVLLKYDPSSEDLNQVYRILDYFNGYFNTLYPSTSRGKYISVKYDILPKVFYFNNTGTLDNYEYFEQDNNLQKELYLKKNSEVFLRDEY